MTLTHGADADRLRQIGALLTEYGRQTTKVGSEGTARVGVLRGAWEGADLEAFDKEWLLAHRSLESAAERLTRMATLMEEQADQQSDASGGAGSALPGPARTGPSPAGPPGPVPTEPPPGTGDSTFDEEVRGTEGQPVDRDLWTLAHHAYGADNDMYDNPLMYDEQPELPEGYTQVDPAELDIDPALLTEEHGMQAEIYRTPDGGYVVAYRGSDEGVDWVTNGRQGIGIDDPQYEQAMQLAAAVDDASGGNVTFTGHSLGGGLAAAAGMATGQPAVTFDAAGVHGDTAERAAEIRGEGATEQSVLAETGQGQIRTYSTSTDILTNAQETVPVVSGLAPDAPGTHIVLETPPSAQGTAVTATGAVIGGVVGGLGGILDGNPLDTGQDIAEGAALGGLIGTGAWGHHWNPMETALDERYPD